MSMHICIYEDSGCNNLLPMAYVRPVYDLFCGMVSIQKKLIRNFPQASLTLHTRSVLEKVVRDRYPDCLVNEFPAGLEEIIFINGRTLLNSETVLHKLGENQSFTINDKVVAARLSGAELTTVIETVQNGMTIDLDETAIEKQEIDGVLVEYIWDLIQANSDQIRSDFAFATQGRGSSVNDNGTVIHNQNVFIDKTAKIMPQVVVDGSNGPVFIDRDVVIQPHVYIQGPVYIGPSVLIKAGAQIYSGSSIAEGCKVGGEVNNSIILAYSNKAHNGYLGSSYVGSWVNIGAGTNNSNLKNNYGTVKLTVNGEVIDTGLQFMGLIMGDHSKCGINTTFNTGTTVGINCNLYGSAIHKRHISSFTWGSAVDDYTTYKLDKALAVNNTVMSRRQQNLSKYEKELLENIFQLTTG
ncbi:MAG: putative sugar nucleotidyl transferase [Candidatus Marinimicrobia bacterium]|nr:putative sugar nucleotidyl transferase [Candidatus Neomarinimicrobiota bacterium]